MKLLLAVLVGLALAKDEKTKKRVKIPMACYGLEDADHDDCSEMSKDPDACKANDKCKFGKDRVGRKTNAIKSCMKKKALDIGKICETTEDCGCGQQCHFWDFMNKNVCSQCADATIEEDCVNMGNMECMWMKKGEFCMQSKNECNELNKKECAKAGDKCSYNKANKMCSKMYVNKCFGNTKGTHNKCYHKETEEDCMSVKSMFNKALCTWGFDKYDDMEKEKIKCIKDTGVSIGKTCTTQADCTCGTTCHDFDGFKVCQLCKDLGIKDDCDKAHTDMGCFWVGKDGAADEGMCLRTENECTVHAFDADGCNGVATCKYDTNTDMCNRGKVTKAMCKGMSKKKKGEKVDMDAMKVRCLKVPECGWNGDKNKCFFRK